MIDFNLISKIFYGSIGDQNNDILSEENIEGLISLLIKTNKKLWDLEDLARMSERGDSHVAETKRTIDIFNQKRNDLITKIDLSVKEHLNVNSTSGEFYSESPGMIIDRLSIIFIKLSMVKKIIDAITDDSLKSEYVEKENILLGQTNKLGKFLDLYLEQLMNKEVYFEPQQAVKIYNDARVKSYIKGLLS